MHSSRECIGSDWRQGNARVHLSRGGTMPSGIEVRQLGNPHGGYEVANGFERLPQGCPTFASVDTLTPGPLARSPSDNVARAPRCWTVLEISGRHTCATRGLRILTKSLRFTLLRLLDRRAFKAARPGRPTPSAVKAGVGERSNVDPARSRQDLHGRRASITVPLHQEEAPPQLCSLADRIQRLQASVPASGTRTWSGRCSQKGADHVNGIAVRATWPCMSRRDRSGGIAAAFNLAASCGKGCQPC